MGIDPSEALKGLWYGFKFFLGTCWAIIKMI